MKVDEVARASVEVRVLKLKSLETSDRAQMSAVQGTSFEPLQYRSLCPCSKSCRRRGSAMAAAKFLAAIFEVAGPPLTAMGGRVVSAAERSMWRLAVKVAGLDPF